MFLSRISMLLYLVKHSRPDIANVARVLSKVMDGANRAAFLEMHHEIKYVLGTKNLGLKIEPKGDKDEPWDIVCFSDSNAGDPGTKRSVIEFILHILGVPVSWRSKAQRSMTLSSLEAEWVALSEAVNKVIFL